MAGTSDEAGQPRTPSPIPSHMPVPGSSKPGIFKGGSPYLILRCCSDRLSGSRHRVRPARKHIERQCSHPGHWRRVPPVNRIRKLVYSVDLYRSCPILRCPGRTGDPRRRGLHPGRRDHTVCAVIAASRGTVAYVGPAATNRICFTEYRREGVWLGLGNHVVIHHGGAHALRSPCPGVGHTSGRG